MKVDHQKLSITSNVLGQAVTIECYHPQEYNGPLPLLLLNDGQDMDAIHIQTILHDCWKRNLCKPFVLIAPHAHKRINWYGVANAPDYKKRGDLAAEYHSFVLDELLPDLEKITGLRLSDDRTIAGFSLGGLSAFDLGWMHPNTFGTIGVFSGSFWWRSKDLKAGYTDLDRIAHARVRATSQKPDLKIWLQCGTLDEEADRNNNGIIDSVDDTEDMLRELQMKGFSIGIDLHYELTIGGRHTLETYGVLLPQFFKWAFPV